MPEAVKSLMVIEFKDTSQPFDRLVGAYGRDVFDANIHHGKLVMYASPESEFGGLVKATFSGVEHIPLFLTPFINASTPQFLLPVSMADKNLRNAYFSLLSKKDKMPTNNDNDNANDNASEKLYKFRNGISLLQNAAEIRRKLR